MTVTVANRLTLDFISDNGHGWVVLPPAALAALRLTPASFTRYSYLDADGTVYAEEDCDAAIAVAAHHRLFGCKPAFRDVIVHGEAPCRRLPGRCTGDPDYRAAVLYCAEHIGRAS